MIFGGKEWLKEDKGMHNHRTLSKGGGEWLQLVDKNYFSLSQSALFLAKRTIK